MLMLQGVGEHGMVGFVDDGHAAPPVPPDNLVLAEALTFERSDARWLHHRGSPWLRGAVTLTAAPAGGPGPATRMIFMEADRPGGFSKSVYAGRDFPAGSGVGTAGPAHNVARTLGAHEAALLRAAQPRAVATWTRASRAAPGQPPAPTIRPASACRPRRLLGEPAQRAGAPPRPLHRPLPARIEALGADDRSAAWTVEEGRVAVRPIRSGWRIPPDAAAGSRVDARASCRIRHRNSPRRAIPDRSICRTLDISPHVSTDESPAATMRFDVVWYNPASETQAYSVCHCALAVDCAAINRVRVELACRMLYILCSRNAVPRRSRHAS